MMASLDSMSGSVVMMADDMMPHPMPRHTHPHQYPMGKGDPDTITRSHKAFSIRHQTPSLLFTPSKPPLHCPNSPCVHRLSLPPTLSLLSLTYVYTSTNIERT